MEKAVLFAVASLIFFTIGDAWLKIPSEKQGALKTTFFITFFSSVVLFILSLFWKGPFGIRAIEYSALSGIFMGTGLLFVLISLEREQMSDTMSLIPVSYLVPVLWGAFVLHESVNVYDEIGAVLIFTGTFFIMFKTLKLNLGLVPALIGNMLWGLQLVSFNYAVLYTRNYPLAGSFGNFVSFLFILIFITIRKEYSFDYKFVWQTFAISVLQSLALLSALIVESLKSVVIGFSVVATEPALLTLMGYFIFKERITVLQMLGVASMFVGLFMLA